MFSKGPSSLIVCHPSQNLTQPSTLSKARNNQKKKVKTEAKAKQVTRLQNNPNKVYAIFSTSQIGTITKAGTSTENRKQHFAQSSSKGSSKVPAII